MKAMGEEYISGYTVSGGLTIAFQIWGSSEETLVYAPGMISHLEAGVEDSEYLAWIRELSKSFRIIIFDKRGQGLSDKDSSALKLEERMDDISPIVAAENLNKFFFFGFSEGAAIYTVIITRNLKNLLGRTKFYVTSIRGLSLKGLEGY